MTISFQISEKAWTFPFTLDYDANAMPVFLSRQAKFGTPFQDCRLL